MKILKITVAIALIAVITLSFNACQQLKEIQQTMTNIGRLEYKLKDVNGFRLAGISLQNKKSINDISITDGLKLTQAFATKRFPAEFTLNVAAKNPNDGTGGYPQTTATISRMEWRLLIDDVPTINGVVDQPITVPGTGVTTTIPIRMQLDLYDFFGNRGYDKIINLALAIGGYSASPTKLKLDIKPTVNTKFGPITYPSRITVVDKQWR